MKKIKHCGNPGAAIAPSNPNRRFILYDGRAADGDTEGASVFCFEDTLREARKSARDHGEAVIFSFVEGPDPQGRPNHYEILDQQFVEVVRS